MITNLRLQLRVLALTTLALLRLPLPGRGLGDREPHERPDGGYTTETVIVTALMVAAAITIVGIIVAKVVARANAITM
jgi:hypothetical protein